ncbi:hypothetical protein HK100_010926 [Physocladia obscura]|uniref:Uncharacterized protein n=1 Tax=Physocladia obscura TaxID=109957 RepID=A0AAD5XGY9_9FUNG|nr:hypothetical protein HK100_010926 [Physocladia obscura]
MAKKGKDLNPADVSTPQTLAEKRAEEDDKKKKEQLQAAHREALRLVEELNALNNLEKEAPLDKNNRTKKEKIQLKLDEINDARRTSGLPAVMIGSVAKPKPQADSEAMKWFHPTFNPHGPKKSAKGSTEEKKENTDDSDSENNSDDSNDSSENSENEETAKPELDYMNLPLPSGEAPMDAQFYHNLDLPELKLEIIAPPKPLQSTPLIIPPKYLAQPPPPLPIPNMQMPPFGYAPFPPFIVPQQMGVFIPNMPPMPPGMQYPPMPFPPPQFPGNLPPPMLYQQPQFRNFNTSLATPIRSRPPPPPPGLAPGTYRNLTLPQKPATDVAESSKTQTATVPVSSGPVVISVAPKMRDLQKELTQFVPPSLLKKKGGNGFSHIIGGTGAGVGVVSAGGVAPVKSSKIVVDAAPDVGEVELEPKFNSGRTTKDDELDVFMKEIEDQE